MNRKKRSKFLSALEDQQKEKEVLYSRDVLLMMATLETNYRIIKKKKKADFKKSMREK